MAEPVQHLADHGPVRDDILAVGDGRVRCASSRSARRRRSRRRCPGSGSRVPGLDCVTGWELCASMSTATWKLAGRSSLIPARIACCWWNGFSGQPGTARRGAADRAGSPVRPERRQRSGRSDAVAARARKARCQGAGLDGCPRSPCRSRGCSIRSAGPTRSPRRIGWLSVCVRVECAGRVALHHKARIARGGERQHLRRDDQSAPRVLRTGRPPARLQIQAVPSYAAIRGSADGDVRQSS